MTGAGTTELVLTRHGRTPWHHDNRYAGRTDLDLDDVGRAQATALAGWARTEPPDALACSPLRRARQTAAPAAAVLGLVPEVVEDLREVDFGSGEGRTLDELRRTDPAAVEAFTGRGEPFPGAEPLDAVAVRVLGALRAVAVRHAGGRVLVVGHNTALRVALCAALGLPLHRYRDLLPRLDNTALTRLRLPAEPDRPPALLALNVPVPATAPQRLTSAAPNGGCNDQPR